MHYRLKDKIALITGAASGIGKASALRFAAEGAIVYANDLQEGALASVIAQIRDKGGQVFACAADVTDAAVVQAMVDHIVQDCGRIDVLYNNAGGDLPTPTIDVSIERYRAVVALNLDSVFYGVKAALPFMIRQGCGVILTTSSGAGLNAVDGLAAYGAAKAGAANLMRSIATEYGKYGIRANTISPGPMATPSFRAHADTLPGGLKAYARQVPSGRLGDAEDIAAAAAFLASDDASFINGVVLPVDGAVHAKLATPQLVYPA
jgi:NAD(P)-dependent dehydrogenase (short-subunit alcohol dehydrogenase family)